MSSSGGNCEEDSDPNVTKHHMFDEKLADVLSWFFTGQTVVGFADGPGQYRDHLLKQGRVISYDAYDVAPFVEKVTGGAVKFMDLTLPQYGLPAYDWVMCLEVAEHIPARYERILVDNMARHARKGVVLSWANISQGGINHVNNKSSEDVKTLLDEAGFYPDNSATQYMRNQSVNNHLRVNNIVFRRKPEAIFHEEDA
ncbi:hypothetical protein C0Q70_17472 [Pomacea canaliculata]|uniref:Methyltransferase type 11 domain-containing protein n=2 Tax=Pomacea canaliculata TaxID=400727 RepID=A0A2T7NKH8_POMCA|nr:hypothetical protein C0Q70_17472 [Pomacea canaliculata]